MFKKNKACILKNPRKLLGVEVVESKLSQSRIHWDMWFTGADFAGSALMQLKAAIHKRPLNQPFRCLNLFKMISNSFQNGKCHVLQGLNC